MRMGIRSVSQIYGRNLREIKERMLRSRSRVIGMKISIYGKQMTVRESLKALVEKKLAKFDKFFGEDADAFVTCKSRKGTKIIEITINYGGTIFRSEDEGETFMSALDRAVDLDFLKLLI